MTTIATLKRLSAKSLSEKILEEVNAADPTFAIIDVRDDGEYALKRRNMMHHQSIHISLVFILHPIRSNLDHLVSIPTNQLCRLHRRTHQGCK